MRRFGLVFGFLLLAPSLSEGTTVLIHQTSESLIFAADTLLTTDQPPRPAGNTCKVRFYDDIAFVAAGSYTDTRHDASFDVYRVASRLLSARGQLSVERRIERFFRAIRDSPFMSRTGPGRAPSLAGFIGAIVDGKSILYGFKAGTATMIKKVPCAKRECIHSAGDTQSFIDNGILRPIVSSLLERMPVPDAFASLIERESRHSRVTGPTADVLRLDANGVRRPIISRCRWDG